MNVDDFAKEMQEIPTLTEADARSMADRIRSELRDAERGVRLFRAGSRSGKTTAVLDLVAMARGSGNRARRRARRRISRG